MPDDEQTLLSFTNLVEAHVLDAIRREHGVQLQKVRDAVRYMQDRMSVEHPLASQAMATDGVDLFVQRYAQLINVSRDGQLAMSAILNAYLRRLEWESRRLCNPPLPVHAKAGVGRAKVVVIDPESRLGSLFWSAQKSPHLLWPNATRRASPLTSWQRTTT